MTRVLVTGVGGAAGVAVVRSLLRRGDVEVLGAATDRWASGLHLVPAENRRLLPAGPAHEVAAAVRDLCERDGVDVLVPVAGAELPRLAAAREPLAAAGTRLLAPSSRTLDTCLDRLTLAHVGTGAVRVPRTELFGTPQALSGWDFPVVVKARRGGGSKEVRTVRSDRELDAVHDEDDLLVQELVPGEEYVVDVLADATGHVVAAVPRAVLRVDHGLAVAGRTVRDAELAAAASAVARAVGLTSVASVRLRRDAGGAPVLLDVDPRFSGETSLTVAAGVDLPSLALDDVLDRDVPRSVDFAEVAHVRYLEDVVVPVGDVPAES